MHYSSFLGRINMENTSEQCFQPLLFEENKKAVEKGTETEVQGQIVDKWTVGSNKEGLYTGVKPPEEEGGEKIKEEH